MAGFVLDDIGTGVDRARTAGAHGNASCRIKPSTHIGLASTGSPAAPPSGAALLMHFTAEQMERLTAQLKPEQPTGLNDCPLPKQGERFPISDPSRAARIAPRPADGASFFLKLLERVASVEAVPYRPLAVLAAPRDFRSIGGGGKNSAWVAIRRRILGVPRSVAEQTTASCGAAVLAWHGGPP